LEALPDSTLPDELRGLGYNITEVGKGERILPTAITERLVAGPDGALAPITEGSTQAATMVVHQAGIVTTKVYSLLEPDEPRRIAP